MIESFFNIKEKENLSFRVFHIESSYRSMAERLLMNAIQFLREITKICNYDIPFEKHYSLMKRYPGLKKMVVRILMSQNMF